MHPEKKGKISNIRRPNICTMMNFLKCNFKAKVKVVARAAEANNRENIKPLLLTQLHEPRKGDTNFGFIPSIFGSGDI